MVSFVRAPRVLEKPAEVQLTPSQRATVHMAASLLLDFYGQTLTGKQQDAMELYYNEDLSLSEIAENLKISRQAALDSIQRAQKHLNKMEHQLGMLKKYRACADAAAEIERLAKGGPAEREILRQVQIIRQAWEDN